MILYNLRTKIQTDAIEKSILDFDNSFNDTFYSTAEDVKTTEITSHEATDTNSITITTKTNQTTCATTMANSLRYVTSIACYSTVIEKSLFNNVYRVLGKRLTRDNQNFS